MKYQTAYCDVDGFIADFHLEAVRAHMRVGTQFPWLNHYGTPLELTYQHFTDRYPRGVSVSKVCVPSIADEALKNHWHPDMDKFWNPIRQDPLFWHNMPAFPWLKDVLELVHQYAHEIVFVTTPDKHRNCYAGKFHWMQRVGLRDYELIFCHRKWRLARPRCVLIDDFEVHIESWKEQVDHMFREPGHAVLFPQPWNELHHINDRLGYLETQLKG